MPHTHKRRAVPEPAPEPPSNGVEAIVHPSENPGSGTNHNPREPARWSPGERGLRPLPPLRHCRVSSVSSRFTELSGKRRREDLFGKELRDERASDTCQHHDRQSYATTSTRASSAGPAITSSYDRSICLTRTPSSPSETARDRSAAAWSRECGCRTGRGGAAIERQSRLFESTLAQDTGASTPFDSGTEFLRRSARCKSTSRSSARHSWQ